MPVMSARAMPTSRLMRAPAPTACTVNSSDSAVPTICSVSLPVWPSKTSEPSSLPWIAVSSPAPMNSASSPAPVSTRSLSSPPAIVSAPRPPTTTSAPAPVSMVVASCR